MKDNKFSDQELEIAANTDIASLAESLGYTVDRKNRKALTAESSNQFTVVRTAIHDDHTFVPLVHLHNMGIGNMHDPVGLL